MSDENKSIIERLDEKASKDTATTSAAGLMSAADKANLDAVYADYTAMLNLI